MQHIEDTYAKMIEKKKNVLVNGTALKSVMILN